MSNTDINAPVFIGGSGSSGSTLLSVLLDRHSQIACGPELSFFNKAAIFGDFVQMQRHFTRWIKHGLRTDGYFRYYRFCTNLKDYGLSTTELTHWLKSSTNLREFCDQFISGILSRQGKRIFAEKTPSNAYCFPQLLQLYPNAHFIHIYRGGRDVVCSLRKRGYSWFEASSMWLYNTAAALRLEEHPSYLAIAYEHLVKQPRQTLEQVCHALGIPFEQTMLHPQMNSREVDGDASQSWTLNPGKTISPRSVGRYWRDLTASGESIFWYTRLTQHGINNLQTDKRTTGDVLKHLGYENNVNPYLQKPGMKGFIELTGDYVYRGLQSIRRIEFPERPLTTCLP